MIELTTSKVDKGSTKFAPSIKPKAQRRKPAAAMTVVEEPLPPSPVKRKRSPSPVKQTEPTPPVQETISTTVTKPITAGKPIRATPATSINIPKPISTPISMPQPIQKPPKQQSKEFELSTATMVELIKSKYPEGRLSSFEVQRRESRVSKKKNVPTPTPAPTPVVEERAGPKITIRDGKMVVETSALSQEPVMEVQEVIEEDVLRYVTSSSFRHKHKLSNIKWTPQMTLRFYQGLSYFGTNFKMISYMFPALTQQHIKLKFRAEESKDASKVTLYLRNREKAPDELKEKILKSVKMKQELEDSRYVNRKVVESRDVESLQVDGEIKGEVKEDTNFVDTMENEDVGATEQQVEQVSEETQEPEVVVEKVVPVELPDLTKPVIKSVSTAPKATRRKKKAIIEDTIPEPLSD